MGTHVFKLPDIGEGIAESEIAAWHVKVGDVIAEEQPLVDMLTDKAAVELPSPVAGKVIELKGAPGDKIAVGGALAVIETTGAGSAAEEKKPATNSAKASATADAVPAASDAASAKVEMLLFMRILQLLDACASRTRDQECPSSNQPWLRLTNLTMRQKS